MTKAPLPGYPAGPLKYLFLGWYAIVTGLAGLPQAWHRTGPAMGRRWAKAPALPR